MTTSSGRRYSKGRQKMENVQSTMEQLLQARQQSFGEDCEKQEQELQEECHQYQKVLAKCDSEIKQQMDVLKGLVQGLKISGEPVSMSQIDSNKEI